MSKLREDYEYVGWRRFVHWVNADQLAPLKKEKAQSSRERKEKQVETDGVHVKAGDAARTSGVKDSDQNDWLKETQENEASISHRVLDWLHQNGLALYQSLYKAFAVLVCITVITVLLVTVSYLPEFGNPDNPANNEVSKRYIENGLQETGAINIVSGMILDYRAFDTLGESHVLFIAACSVLILLRIDHDKKGNAIDPRIAEEENDRKFEPKNDVILQTSARVLVPVIFLFGIYVVLNGHLSAGGGFSGGAIIGAGLILYLNAFGFKKTERFFTYKTFQRVSLCALLAYAGLKSYAFYTGANHIESVIPLGQPGAILSSGLILPLDIAVGCVVACTMYAFYTMFRKGGM